MLHVCKQSILLVEHFLNGLFIFFKEVSCLKYLRSQVAEDGGCDWDVVHNMNTWYKLWGELKSVLINRGLGINTGVCMKE